MPDQPPSREEEDVSDRLAEIRERLEAASEPVLSTWVCFDGWGPPPDGDRMRAASISDGQSDVVAPHPRGEEIIAREEDLQFICHAPEDVSYLLDRIEAQREVMEAARDYVHSGAVNERERLRETLDNLEGVRNE